MRAKITKRVVDGAEPREATFLVRDTEVRGFVLVVTPAGAKSYAVDYRAGSGRGSREIGWRVNADAPGGSAAAR